ncbi:DUF4856 domain-containing protein [Aquirufa aurantiipilula]|uniref:DUF4856 domain-containing protein n=1 Tax=Aquirufa aurantiipilula TaxID=2696561 RepID=A0ABT6BG99_9BACT|nr:DUF4856 domain-containing protein [Aquirufa aurantiipilula]MBZ1326355.1 DUF4856 domain-containing protein [Aquirufa aurantiipilula]MDF5689465.1 DUF4856 domain-containing protein [Aquirufa aurantiipilula]
MPKNNLKLHFIWLFASLLGFSSCENSSDVVPNLRSKVDYSLLTPSTPYKQYFIDAKGDTTVDLKSGNTRYKMFAALNYYLGAAVRDNKALDANLMKAMYANSANSFTDIASLKIVGTDLNTSGLALRNSTASSKSTSEAELARTRLDALFVEMATVSNSFATTASKGVAGKLGTYLVDSKGIETAQIIQKSLIGALQLDYIGNVLLTTGLTADNYTLVSGKKYTALEHNWDEAYGLLTLNPIYLAGSTDAVRGTSESFLGSYIWEYNKASYANFHSAFLKGRAAIVNNDLTELKKQAAFIRTESEKAIASAAVGYLAKWKTGTTDAARAHAIGEGLGFIYSLRYCTSYNVDAKFSDDILTALISSPNGFWDLTNDKINAASAAISTKFKL